MDINWQPRKKSELYPIRLQLLTKRVKKCKDCQRKIMVPNDRNRVNLLMNLHIPKVTIYRFGRYDPANPTKPVDLMLMFRNPNNSVANISFAPLTPE